MFVDPRGHMEEDFRPRAPRLPERPVEGLVQQNRAHGVEPDWRTAGAKWKRESDVPDELGFRVLEALE